MAEITKTKAYKGEFAGEVELFAFNVVPGSASDTITLSAADGVAEIEGVVGAVITGGISANFALIQVSFTGLVVTVKSLKPDGVTAASAWTNAGVTVTLLIKSAV